MRVVILPGMGCTPVDSCNWYSWLQHRLEQEPFVEECILRDDFPEPNRCRQSVWIPFVRNTIGLDDNTVLVGHSTGACCAMRLLEADATTSTSSSTSSSPPLLGAVLVAVAHTDLRDAHEKASQYFDEPWDFASMQQGAQHIHIFHSQDDPLIPVQEARYVAQQLQQHATACATAPTPESTRSNTLQNNIHYHEFQDASHFFEPHVEILNAIRSMASESLQDSIDQQ